MATYDFELAFDTRIRFQMEDTYGTKIYRDPMNYLLIKIEDIHSNFDPAPYVNFQGDRYMGRDGATYLFIDYPDVVDVSGKGEPREITSGHLANEGPTRPLHTPPNETEKVVSVQDITSAQANAKEQNVGEHGDIPRNKKGKSKSWKERRARRVASKKRQNEKEQLFKEGQKQIIEPVPLNKEGEYYEGEDRNTTLPVEYAGHSILAILDCGAGVSVVTKKVWENWGKPPLQQTGMKLKLADGYIERPIGLLEKIIVTSCGVGYEHMFAIVDFGNNTNYDIILGRPFMRQLKMIHDWGSNYIYLRQQHAVTRVNLIDHSYGDVARTPVEDLKSNTSGASTVPSWVNSRIHKWMSEASDNESFNKEHSIEKTLIDDEDCNIVPIRTIHVISNSEDSSVQGQQDLTYSSLEAYSLGSLTQLDAGPIHYMPSPYGFTTLYKNYFGVTFELIYPNPSNYVHKQPWLRMLQEPKSKTIVYQDDNSNIFRPVHPLNLSDEEAKGWCPFLTHINPRDGQVLILHQGQRSIELEAMLAQRNLSTPTHMVESSTTNQSSSLIITNQQTIGATTNASSSQEQMSSNLLPTKSFIPQEQCEPLGNIQFAKSVNDQQASRPTLSHPPGFDPIITSQPMQDKEDSMKCERQVVDNQELPMQDQRMLSHGLVVPTTEGPSYYQQSPSDGRAVQPVSTSNSTLHMHYTHPGDRAPTSTVTSYTRAQSVAPPAFISHGTYEGALQLQNPTQPYAFDAHIAEHLRSQYALLLRNSLKGTQDLPKVAHITQDVSMAPENEQIKPSKEPLALEIPTSEPQEAIAYQSQACIEKEQESPLIISSSPGKPLGEGAAPIFIFGATNSLKKSSPKHAHEGYNPKFGEVMDQASTTPANHVVVDSTNLQSQYIPMKPLSEYRVEGSFQLRSVTTASSIQGLYEDNQGGQFQLLLSPQGKELDKPRVFKYLHVKDLTYAYKDTEGNEYQPYHEPDDAFNDKAFQQSRMCEGCGVSHFLQDCPMLMLSKKVLLESAVKNPMPDADAKKQNSPTPSIQPSPRESIRSPPKSPQKRQILPQSTTNLLKSQVRELQADNAKLEQARGESVQLSGAIEQKQQASSEPRRQEDAREVHEATSSKKGGNADTSNKEVAHDNQESLGDQRANIAKKDTEASKPQQQKSVDTNVPSKSTTPTGIKFDIVGKTGVKLPSLALVDLTEEKNFMSYSTWVLSGQPTLDKAKKTIQAGGKSSDECFGMVESSIYINSRPLEGEFYVMAPKHMQKDLVMGRKLAKQALDLLKSQVVQQQGLKTQIPRNQSASTPTGAESSIGQEQAQSIQQEPVQPSLKIEDGASTSSTKQQEPNEKAKRPTQATTNHEDTYVPPARIIMSIRHQDKSTLQRLALIDMSADKNMMSHQTWCLLGKPNLDPTTKFVQKSSHVFGDCLGVIEVFLEISDHSETAKFYVMAPGNLYEEIVLSRTWMAKRNCTIGWHFRHMSIVNDKRKVVVIMLAQGVQETSPKVLEHMKSIPKKPASTTSTYKEKGKAKVESDSRIAEISTSTSNNYLPNQLTKEQTLSSSTKRTQKVYQPKYPSARAQQRRKHQAFVPKHMVQVRKLSEGDTHSWVERHATTSQTSSGWLSTHKSLEAQDYFQGNRSLWMPKPEFTVYKVPSIHQRRRQPTQGERKKHKASKQRRQRRSTDGQHAIHNTMVKTGLPKERLAQMSTNTSNLVRIQARSTTSKAYKEWIIPQDLLTAQGYYEGQTQLWLPKALAQTKTKSSLANVDKPHALQTTWQWRPIQATSVSKPSYAATTSQVHVRRKSLIPKDGQGTHLNQAITIKQEHKWVPKKPPAAKEPQTSSKPTSNTGQRWVPKQGSPKITKEEANLESIKDVSMPMEPSQFFMTINPIFDPSPIQDLNQIVDEILCQWGM